MKKKRRFSIPRSLEYNTYKGLEYINCTVCGSRLFFSESSDKLEHDWQSREAMIFTYRRSVTCYNCHNLIVAIQENMSD